MNEQIISASDYAEEKVQSNHGNMQENFTINQSTKLKDIKKMNKQKRRKKITQTLRYAQTVLTELNNVDITLNNLEFNDVNLLYAWSILSNVLENGSDRNNHAYKYIKRKMLELLPDAESLIKKIKQPEDKIIDSALKERLKNHILLDWKYKVLMNTLVFIEYNAKKQKKIFNNLNLLRVGIEKINARYEYQKEAFNLIMSFWDNIEIKSDGKISIISLKNLDKLQRHFVNYFQDKISKNRKDDSISPIGFTSLVGGGTTFFLISMGAISGPVSIVICATLLGIGAIDFLHKFFAKSYNFLNHYQITKSEGYQNITESIGNLKHYDSEHKQEVESESVSEAQKNGQFKVHANRDTRSQISIEQLISSMALDKQDIKAKAVSGGNILKSRRSRSCHSYFSGFGSGRDDDQEAEEDDQKVVKLP